MKMKYLFFVTISIFAIVNAVPNDDLLTRMLSLRVDIEEFKNSLQNETEFNKGEFWVLEEQDSILRDIIVQLDKFSKQVDKVEQTVTSEVLRIEDILQRGPTTSLPITKDNLLEKAAEYLKIIDDALVVLKVHPDIHAQDLDLLNKQDVSLKALITELTETTDPDVIERNMRALNDLESEIQSEIIRLKQLIREATTVVPN